MLSYKRAFTLVELLVVISIIALLLSILVPALGKAKLAAWRVVCGNHVRQQALVQHTYGADFKGKFPEHCSFDPMYVYYGAGSNPNGEPGSRIQEDVRVAYDKYVTDPWIFTCPYMKNFGKKDPLNTGYLASPLWLGPPNAKGRRAGGWAGKENGRYPVYVLIPFSWFANYSPNGNPIDWKAGNDRNPIEPAWPRNLAECTSKNVMVTHAITYRYSSSGGYTDYGHGGTLGKIKKFATAKSLDNDVAFGDGHVEFQLKSKMRWRALYTTGWGEQQAPVY